MSKCKHGLDVCEGEWPDAPFTTCCRLCWKESHPESGAESNTRRGPIQSAMSTIAFAAMMHAPRTAKQAAHSPSPPRATPCVHLGPPTGDTVLCPTCTGKVSLKLFGCGVHGKCTQGKKAAGVACCATCPDYESP